MIILVEYNDKKIIPTMSVATIRRSIKLKKIIFSFILLTFTINCFAEPSLYIAARKKVNIPKESRAILDLALDSDWNDDEAVLSLLEENKEALALFKEAINQKSDGHLFVEKPEKLDSGADIPNYSEEMFLLNLLLLEAKLHKSKNDFSKVERNYLLATKFTNHLFEERFPILLVSLLGIISFNKTYPFLEESIKSNLFSKKYYNELLKNLKILSENQDFLKSGFKQEYATQIGIIKSLEEVSKEEDSLDILFKYNPKKKNKENVKYDPRFFKIFYEEYENLTLAISDALISGTAINDSSIYEKKLKKFNKHIEKMSNPFFLISHYIKKMIFERKSGLFMPAQTMAMVMAAVAVPQFTKLINKYHAFYNDLNVLKVGLSSKLYYLDNGYFPQTLQKLIPEYLDKTPVDTYNGFKSLTYKNKNNGFIVYSFGLDRKDDRGKIIFNSRKYFNYKTKSKDKSIKGDIVFSMD